MPEPPCVKQYRTQVAIISRDVYNVAQSMRTAADLDSIKGILRSSELFRGLTEEEIDRLLPLCQEEVFEAGTEIFCEGGECQYVRMLRSGRVALETELALSRSSVERATVDVLSQGSSFCWSALMETNILTASGRCMEDADVIAIDGARLRALLGANPLMGYKVAQNLVKVVGSRMEHTKLTAERMLSVIFHDLKAPLAAAESYNRLLLDGFVGELSEEQRNILQRSSKRLSDLLGLIGNMIDISRIDWGDLRMEEVSLPEIVRDCVDTMRPLADEKGLQLDVEEAPELPAVRVNGGRMKQVITNLLSNAIKFTESGGVTVSLKEDKGRLRVDVSDTGIGVPAESLPKIFDGFYAGLNAEKRGAGLGLSITKRIVDSHGGRIWATSPCSDTGKGSRFTFVLPGSSGKAE